MTTSVEFSTRPSRLLIIRFSSFGDIVQALSVPAAYLQAYPNSKVDWLIRDDFKSLVVEHPLIENVLPFRREQGLIGLVSLGWKLGNAGYTHVYDAHCNLRSFLIKTVLRLSCALHSGFGTRFITRPKNRIRRYLFFKWRLHTLPTPFRGCESFLWPLAAWEVGQTAPLAPQFFTSAQLTQTLQTEWGQLTGSKDAQAQPQSLLAKPCVALVASAAWEMKRWPVAHWKELINLWTDATFVLLGGPEDTFFEEIRLVAPKRILNLAGRLSLSQSCALIKKMDLVIANDTGLLHVADQLGRPTLALIGPTAFGYPSQPTSRYLEIKLGCQPCSKDGRGRCVNDVYKRCLRELTPAQVLKTSQAMLCELAHTKQPTRERDS